MAAAHRPEKAFDRDVERVSECVPSGDAASRSSVLQIDQGASGQAAELRELVEGPSALGPQLREPNAQRQEVGLGREDRHISIGRCRTLPCQCRLLHYL